MQVPEGLRSPAYEGKVCKLNKALYGLKQSPRQWYAKIDDYLVNDLHFKSSIHDPCLYVKKTPTEISIIALYVDDLLIIGNSKVKIDQLKGEFKKRFEMKDIGPVKIMLGIEISRDRPNRRLFISQKDYITNILERFRMETSKLNVVPMDTSSLKTSKDVIDREASGVPYRQAIGSLIYLVTGTRPDIAFAVSFFSQYLDKPRYSHWMGVKKILKYLTGTRTHGILYDGMKGIKVQGYSDSDFAADQTERKSTSAYVFTLAGGAISWKSKKQSSTATSTCEAEYIACCSATKEAVWLSRLMADIHQMDAPEPIKLGVDPQGTISLAKNPAIN